MQDKNRTNFREMKVLAAAKYPFLTLSKSWIEFGQVNTIKTAEQEIVLKNNTNVRNLAVGLLAPTSSVPYYLTLLLSLSLSLHLCLSSLLPCLFECLSAPILHFFFLTSA